MCCALLIRRATAQSSASVIKPRRIRQWLFALRLAGVKNVPWFGLVSAVFSGPVPRNIWRARLRYGCFKCPLYSSIQMPDTTKLTDRTHLCRSTHPDMLGVGCGCELNLTAMWANPHGKGCFGQDIDPDLGWPPYYWPSRWARVRAVIDFVFRR